ncbi:MAG: fibronectin type III domain-containing protein [Actinomycetes bacterium]
MGTARVGSTWSVRLLGALVAVALAVFGVTVAAPPAMAVSAGTFDPVFGIIVGTGFNGDINSIARQADGKLLVGGSFTQFNGMARSRLIRLNSDGTLDTSFTQTGSGIIGDVYAVAVQGDGKIVVGGNFSFYSLTPRANVLRLNADGTLDTSFGSAIGLFGQVNALCLLPDNKVLVGGSFAQFGAVARHRIAALNADGSLDISFNPGFGLPEPGFDAPVQAIMRTSSGDVWVGGQFTSFRGTAVRHLARLNSTGTAALPPTSGYPGLIYSIVPSPEGGVLVGGSGVLARYTSAGVLDPTFVAGPAASLPSYVFGIAVQTDGKIVAVGRSGLVGWAGRFTTTGALDPSFVSGPRFSANANTVALLPSGAAVVGGSFATVDGAAAVRIARLTADPSPPPTRPSRASAVTLTFKAHRTVVRWRAPASDGGAAITRYDVRLSLKNSTTRYRAWKRTTVTRYAFTNLARWGKYRVQIRAVNAAGAGPVLTKGFNQRR